MKKGSSAIIIILIALLVAILIALYAVFGFGLGQDLFSKRNLENTVGPQVPRDSQLEKLNSQSSSDEIEAIEADLEDTDLENLDKELVDVDNELQELLGLENSF